MTQMTKNMKDFKKRIKRNQTNRHNQKKMRPLATHECYDVSVIVRGILETYPCISLSTVRELRRAYQTERADEMTAFLVRNCVSNKLHELSIIMEDE